MGLTEKDSDYILDKKEVLSVMEMMADAGNQSDGLASSVRNLQDLLKSGKPYEDVKDLLETIKMDVDICNIYIKESKAKMVSLTKNQLPF